jgi:hypothetical protein
MKNCGKCWDLLEDFNNSSVIANPIRTLQQIQLGEVRNA